MFGLYLRSRTIYETEKMERVYIVNIISAFKIGLQTFVVGAG